MYLVLANDENETRCHTNLGECKCICCSSECRNFTIKHLILQHRKILHSLFIEIYKSYFFFYFLSRLGRSHCRMCWQNMFKNNIEKKIKSSSMLIQQLVSSIIVFISVEKRCQISASQTENIK